MDKQRKNIKIEKKSKEIKVKQPGVIIEGYYYVCLIVQEQLS